MMTVSTNEKGMTLMAVMVFMTIFAFVLMAAAPSIQMDVQREKELEAIRRGEEIAAAIDQYVVYNQGRKLPQSIDELLEGQPDGTKKRQILRASSATDPLSADGRWRLIQPEPEVIARFAKRVQAWNNGVLPSTTNAQYYNRYTVAIANILNTETEDEKDDAEEEDDFAASDDVPFIGVASQSRGKSILAYYGVENHSKWIFTPLFRGTGATVIRPTRQPNR
ncbi:MAG: type II secretion system protein [Acidobacteria bacterium]|nr:type II secretion system protein [Acidobacteriota bacterium]